MPEETRTRMQPPRETGNGQPPETGNGHGKSGTGTPAGADDLAAVLEELRQAQDGVLSALRSWQDTALTGNRTLVDKMFAVSEQWLHLQRLFLDTIVDASRDANTRLHTPCRPV